MSCKVDCSERCRRVGLSSCMGRARWDWIAVESKVVIVKGMPAPCTTRSEDMQIGPESNKLETPSDTVSNESSDSTVALYISSSCRHVALVEMAARLKEALSRGLWKPRSNRAHNLLENLATTNFGEVAQ